MPEGPEVIITAQYLLKKLKNKQIVSITSLNNRFSASNIKGFKLTENSPLTINSIDSKGKFLWFTLTDKNNKKIYMFNSLLLTGRWSFYNDKSTRLSFSIKSHKNNNKKYTLYYIDDMNIGHLSFTDNETDLQKKLNELSPDVLKTDMTDEDLVNMIKHYITSTTKKLNLVKILLSGNRCVDT